jgi:two-component system chemotaxis response regulator CheB
MKARVLLVDDSSLLRAVLREVLGAAKDLEVVGEASDGLAAIEAVRRLDPDVVTMDLLMPMMSGQDTIRRIMREKPTPIVVLAKPSARPDNTFIECLQAGAMEAFAKPSGGFDEHQARELVSMLRRVAALKSRLNHPRPAAQRPARPAPIVPPEAVGIVGSTGAPRLIQALLAALPRSLTCPVFVVQHTAQGFAPSLVRWFASGTRLDVHLAADGQIPQPGEVVVAPDDAHLVVGRGGRVLLLRDPPIDGHRPSGTALLRSLADVYGARALGVVLTGMGRDGAAGLGAIAAERGTTMVEDPRTAVVPGMPREAKRLAHAAIVETAERLPALLFTLATGGNATVTTP